MTGKRVAIATFALLLVAAAMGDAAWLVWGRQAPGIVGSDGSLDLKVMGAFPLSDSTGTDRDIPAAFRALEGRAVSVAGLIYAPNSASDRIGSFQFIDHIPHDHSGPPRVQDQLFCTVVGAPVENPGMYTLVGIHGRLHVGIQHDGSGKVCSVYRMDVDRVTPVP